jgi:hypothetical protein
MDKRTWARRRKKIVEAAENSLSAKHRSLLYDPYLEEITNLTPDNVKNSISKCASLGNWYHHEAVVCSFARNESCHDLWCKSLGYHLRTNVWLPRKWTAVFKEDPRFTLLNSDAGEPLAHMLTLGWTREAILFATEQMPRVARGYFGFFKHDGACGRMGKFIFRLFLDWQQWNISLPHDVTDIELYATVLNCWRDPGFERLTPALLECCDWHLEQTHHDTDENTYEFNSMAYAYPIEILAVFRLRELCGLTNPKLDHPLMNSPLGVLPPPQPWYTDPTLEKLEAALRKEIPEMFVGIPAGYI